MEFDANQDGRFNASDAKWTEFKLWRDLNTNGVSDAGELQTLADAGIKTVFLRANTLNQLYGEHALVRGFTRVEMTDGRMLQAGDVQFTFAPEGWTPPVHATTSASNVRGLTREEIAALEADARQQIEQATRAGDTVFKPAAGSVQPGERIYQKTLTEEGYRVELPNGLFSTLGFGQIFTVTRADGSALPPWLSVSDGVLQGRPGSGEVGLWSLQVHARDMGGQTATAVINLEVSATNTVPVAYGHLPPQTVREGETFELDIAPNIFRDNDVQDILRLAATRADGSSLPSWLRFDEETLRFHGTPRDADVGAVEIRLTARDKGQASADLFFKLVVDNVNNAPVAATAPLPVALDLGKANAIPLPAGIFTDADLNDRLAYTATLVDGSPLPSWLTFNTTAMTFSGTPTAQMLSGRLQVKITATDLQGESASVLVDFMPRLLGTTGKDTLTGGAGWEYIDGGAEADDLRGGAGNDVLIGGDGGDLLDGGTGMDVMVGGAGSDIYTVDNAGDVVTEEANGGTEDTVLVGGSMNYVIPDHVEMVRRHGAVGGKITGSARNDTVWGGDGDDVLVGLDGDDLLNGGVGYDELTGGDGSDIYQVTDGNDFIVEMAEHQGNDQIILYSQVGDFAMPDHVESLSRDTGSGASTVTWGNETGNRIMVAGQGATVYGQGGDDYLTDQVTQSASGNQTFHGGAGNDTLESTGGADSLYGGLGDDVYIQRGAGGLVEEKAGEGIDQVHYLADTDYVLGDHIENVARGTTAFHRKTTGNALNNVMTGSQGNDTLRGEGGADTLDGNGGTDSLIGGAGNDRYIFGWGGTGGSDVIVEDLNRSVGGLQDSIVFQHSTSPQNLTGVRNASTVTIRNQWGDQMTFDWSATQGNAIEQFIFNGGALVWGEADINKWLNRAPTGSVAISGTATQGQTLTASHTLADADGLGTVTYEWLRNGATFGVSGATY
ncbi:MAG: hypothetical protein EON93_08155, partial [Burkholderiales bacterium]